MTNLVIAELRHRPARAAFLLAGYAFGVSVMVVLLAVGEAMLSQARDQELLGGGDLIIVPTGISPEMLKAGGTSSLFLGIDQARFIHRQILESPRGREDYGVTASSPLLDARIVRIHSSGDTLQALASADIPSRAAAVGAAPNLLAGSWSDSESDRRWAQPAPHELFNEIDAFHRPAGAAAADSTWAEWHYFNVMLDADRWIYLTYTVAGRIGIPGEWGGQLLLTMRDPASGHRSLTRDISEGTIQFDTASADVTLDEDATVRQVNGRYHLIAKMAGVDIDLQIQPRPGRFFPPAELGGAELESGYVVPALAATAEGRVCLPQPGGASRCEELSGARAYHDHNWGVWRDVSWEWGAASDETTSLLYGVVRGEGVEDQGLFAYLVDDRGVIGLYRPGPLAFDATERVEFEGRVLEVPSVLSFEDSRRGLHVRIPVDARQITDTARDRARYFLQMRGVATVTRAGAETITLPGFFETYVDALPEP
jgi:hypothetical protein